MTEHAASGREEKVWNPDSRFARESPASGVGEQESTPMSNCRSPSEGDVVSKQVVYLTQEDLFQRCKWTQIICICPDICDFSDLHYRHCRTSASSCKLVVSNRIPTRLWLSEFAQISEFFSVLDNRLLADNLSQLPKVSIWLRKGWEEVFVYLKVSDKH